MLFAIIDPSLDVVNTLLNAVQTGGLVAFLMLSIIALVWGWVYPRKVVEEYKQQVKDLTIALNKANEGMGRMSDAWEARNDIERQNADWDRRQGHR